MCLNKRVLPYAILCQLLSGSFAQQGSVPCQMLTWLPELRDHCWAQCGDNANEIWLPGSSGSQEGDVQSREKGWLLSPFFHYILILYSYHFIYIYFNYLYTFYYYFLSFLLLDYKNIDIYSKNLERVGNPWCSYRRKMLSKENFSIMLPLHLSGNISHTFKCNN